MNLPLKDMAGKQIGEIEVSDAIFAAPVNKSVMHQALLRQLSNARQGTHKTKTRGEVAGGGRKPFKQKGTGRARQGSTRAPNWIGGGTVFGPTPRKYIKQLPKKMFHAALRSALTVKAAAGQIVVLDSIDVVEPKTKRIVEILNALALNTGTVLMALPEKNELVQRSANNLPNIKLMLSGYLNVRDVLGYDTLLLSKSSIEHIENWLGSNGDSDEPAVETEGEGA
ncbi:MAG: 50S ribosomal protein L4 [Chloroflexi bacterium]|nr:50S ribosomal protein L4 [Chloroflexota bacterium]